MRLVVTGAGGRLGRAFLRQVSTHHEVSALDHGGLDVGDHDAVRQTIEPLRPDAVINLAAFTQVDANEVDRDRAVRTNAMGPHNVALAARACGAALLHVSTDFVFDGAKGAPYDELDRPAPSSVYGRTKLEGERHVRMSLREHLIVRTSYVFGGGSDYVTSAVRTLADGGSAGGLSDRVGSPTWVDDLAVRLLPLLLTRRWGTYHVAGVEPASWYELLRRARTTGRLPGDVMEQTSEPSPPGAPRPRYSALTSVYLPHLSVPPMPTLDASLEAFLAAALHAA
jgi:dTDP-4-dehydrorhamnose reductase